MCNKVVTAITGGAGGFGEAAAIELGKKGTVLLGDFDEVALEKQKARLESLSIDVNTMYLDVRDKVICKEFAEYAASIGDVKHVINIAGVGPHTSYIEDQPVSSPELTFQTNSIGTIYITDSFYEVIAEDGVMINFGSLAGHYIPVDEKIAGVFDSCYEDSFLQKLVGMVSGQGKSELEQSQMSYLLCKAFVIHYTKRNAKRFAANKKSRILTVSPGAHWTRHIWDLPDVSKERTMGAQIESRWGKTVEMGEILSFLCSEKAGFITGVDILVDGGALANVKVKQID
ncbi:SDR family oxidoreductase [Alkalibacter mobilis]|uniref:SDR family oxidoreductase n=1 Tax=Alkalibacter mobilis TaxID=2787712 RepID=UPI00189F844C|nr:SDR family oxidoreductase [Alkalibacter mobilis]MBF7096831.1 SDR family oxidoreductase [Alkalibacter mobilis]